MIGITELKYSNTNTYLIRGENGGILFDTGWAGTYPAFCAALGAGGKKLTDIDYILISHFHPDHMGIAQEIADKGPKILIADLQKGFVHSSDVIFEKDKRIRFEPIVDVNTEVISVEESREFLKKLGVEGEILYTPGHSDDSISLWLDEGYLFVGDLNPLYELELHKGTQIGESWEKLLALKPKKVFYGHAKTAELAEVKSDTIVDYEKNNLQEHTISEKENKDDLFRLVSQIMKYIDKGYSLDRIQRKTGADPEFIEDVNRMYLTHQNVGVQGILDRIEIKNK
ncbi:Glyoxylase, beta-lactamase superfamily II [Eubacterium ruminantium]|nr:Glyoxylase, beta-lactamase superfamily II [Eubacterium ruminantium]